jgi:DUF305 family protein family protein
MNRHLYLCIAATALSLAGVVALGSAPTLAGQSSAEFQAENDAAMSKMMTGMTIKYSGDVDRDFADMMIAHHQGAIDMAEAELRHGRNEQLRRIAQEIIVEQQQEISAMRFALGDTLPASAPTPDSASGYGKPGHLFPTPLRSINHEPHIPSLRPSGIECFRDHGSRGPSAGQGLDP